MISELDLIRRIKALSLTPPGAEFTPRSTGGSTRPGAQLLQGIGDDCAVFAPGGSASLTLVTTDTLVEGVHFDLSWHPPELLGHKAVAVNVSDIAAMGGNPRFALLSLAAPPTFGLETLERFVQGFMATLTAYQITLIGGDTVKSDQGLVLSVTVLGEVERQQVVYRAGASAGDEIWVSGYLGQAAAGLEICRQRQAPLHQACPELVAAHLDPVPEVALGRALAESGLVTAMIDMSDGLASDLAHVCVESGVGALVQADQLPLSASTRQTAQALGLEALRLAIAGGEDYRLLFTSKPAARERIQELAGHAVGGQLFRIGTIVDGQGVLLSANGHNTRIDFQGYDHFGGGS